MKKTTKDFEALSRQNNTCLNSLLRWNRKVLAQTRNVASVQSKEYAKATVEAILFVLAGRAAS